MGYFTPVYHRIPPSRRYLAASISMEHAVHVIATHCVFDGATHVHNLVRCDASFDLLCDFVSNPSREVAADLALYARDRCRSNPRLLDHHGELAYANGWAHRIPDLRVRCVAAHDDWTCLVEVGDRLQAVCWGRGTTKLYRLDDALADGDCRAILADCIAACYQGYEAVVGLPAVLAAIANDPWQAPHDCWFCPYEQVAAVGWAARDMGMDPLLRRIACAYDDDWPAGRTPSVRELRNVSASICDGGDEMGELHLAYVEALIRRAAAAGLLALDGAADGGACA